MRALLLLLLLALPCLAQNVQFTAQVDSTVVPVNGQITLTANLSGDVSDYVEPVLPPTDGFTSYRAGGSTNIQIVNGQMSSVASVSWVLVALKKGSHVIGPLEVNINGQVYFSNAITVTVTDSVGSNPPPGTGGPPGGPPMSTVPGNLPPAGGWQPPPVPRTPSRRVFVESSATPKNPYVNQRVDYVFRFFHAVNLVSPPSYEPPSATGSLRADLEQKNSETERDGQRYAVSDVKTAFFPTAPGPFEIGETRLTCQIDSYDPMSMAPDDFNNFLANGNVRELKTAAESLEVRPLPIKGRPDDFSGAVGNFQFTARLDKTSLKAGEPVNLILTAEGDGHPDLISDPKLPPLPGFKVFGMKSASTIDKNTTEFHGRRVFTVPLVPTESGTLKLPGLRFSYFDPHEERYQTIEAPALSIDVAPGKTVAPAPKSTPGAEKPAEAGPTPDEGALGVRGVHTSSSLSRGSNPVSHPLFWLLQLVPLAVLLTVLGLRSYREHRVRTSGERRRSSAYKRSRKALRGLAGVEPTEGYGKLYKTMHAYLEDRLGQNFSGASLAELEARLAARGLAEEPRVQLRQLLEAAETSRYAPTGGAGNEYKAHLKMAERALQDLEKAL